MEADRDEKTLTADKQKVINDNGNTNAGTIGLCLDFLGHVR